MFNTTYKSEQHTTFKVMIIIKWYLRSVLTLYNNVRFIICNIFVGFSVFTVNFFLLVFVFIFMLSTSSSLRFFFLLLSVFVYCVRTRVENISKQIHFSLTLVIGWSNGWSVGQWQFSHLLKLIKLQQSHFRVVVWISVTAKCTVQTTKIGIGWLMHFKFSFRNTHRPIRHTNTCRGKWVCV